MRPLAISAEGQRALSGARNGLWGIALLTAVIALFPIALALFTLMLFDVAMPGRSGATLVGIVIITIGVLGVNLFLMSLRRDMIMHLGPVLAAAIGNRPDVGISRMTPLILTRDHGVSVTEGLDAIRAFLNSRAASAWLDACGMPLYLLTMLFLQGWLAALLLGVAVVAVLVIQRALKHHSQATDGIIANIATRKSVAEAAWPDAPLIRAMGMQERVARSWQLADHMLAHAHREMTAQQRRFVAMSEGLIFVMGVSFLAVGAWLAEIELASVGTVVAASVLALLALRPFMQMMESIPLMWAAREGWWRIDDLLTNAPPMLDHIALPQPRETLECEGLAVLPPGHSNPALRNISFSLVAGDVLAVIGVGGSGKSALLHALSGAWAPASGKVRLDGGALDQWDSDDLARHIGFIPQHGGLMTGTVAENICRFSLNARPEAIIEAAQVAGVHAMILRLPDGYGTQVGPNGSFLSQSQARRIALARALHENPFLLALDQPTAHLDPEGEQALVKALTHARERGAITVLAGNDRMIVEMASKVLILRGGVMTDFGPKEEVRARSDAARKKLDAAKGITAKDVQATVRRAGTAEARKIATKAAAPSTEPVAKAGAS
ncbi:MAG: ATP-binding cassette domain-containing protein [Sphingobium sp.]